MKTGELDHDRALCQVAQDKAREQRQGERVRSVGGGYIMNVESAENVIWVKSAVNFNMEARTRGHDERRRDATTTMCRTATMTTTIGKGGARWYSEGDHNPYRTVRIGEATNPGPRVMPDDVMDPSPSLVPTDVSAPSTQIDPPTSPGSPLGALLEVFAEMDSEGEGSPRDCGLREAAPESRQSKRWQAKGMEVCTACCARPPRGRWAYMCSACPAFYCNAQCPNRAFDGHVCVERGAGVAELSPTTLADPGRRGWNEKDQVNALVTNFSNQDCDALLARAVARPALRTMERIPRQHRSRVADMLGDLTHAHVDAQWAAERGGGAAEAGALRAARMLWVAPTLLLTGCAGSTPTTVWRHSPLSWARAESKGRAMCVTACSWPRRGRGRCS